MTEQELKTRRAPQTFNVRLDLLQQLSERTPKGQWSRWLEQILIRELQGDSYRQDKMNWSPNKKIPMPQLSTATATGILSKQKTTIGRLRFWDGFSIQFNYTSIFSTAQILSLTQVRSMMLPHPAWFLPVIVSSHWWEPQCLQHQIMILQKVNLHWIIYWVTSIPISERLGMTITETQVRRTQDLVYPARVGQTIKPLNGVISSVLPESMAGRVMPVSTRPNPNPPPNLPARPAASPPVVPMVQSISGSKTSERVPGIWHPANTWKKNGRSPETTLTICLSQVCSDVSRRTRKNTNFFAPC